MIELSEFVRADILRGFGIPTNPDVLTKIEYIQLQANVDLLDLAEVIVTDVGLSALLLKLVNSPDYGLNKSVSDIKQAVMFLGKDLTEAVINMNTQCQRTEPLQEFWDNSIQLANVATFIACQLKQQIEADFIYTLGLFLDCGVSAFISKYDNYKNIMIHFGQSEKSCLVALEQSHYTTDHAIVGYYLAKSWRLPDEICYLILCHHDRDFLIRKHSDRLKISYAIIKAAENIVSSYRKLIPSNDWYHIQKDVLDIMGMDAGDYRDIWEDAEVYIT